MHLVPIWKSHPIDEMGSHRLHVKYVRNLILSNSNAKMDVHCYENETVRIEWHTKLYFIYSVMHTNKQTHLLSLTHSLCILPYGIQW